MVSDPRCMSDGKLAAILRLPCHRCRQSPPLFFTRF